MKSLLRMLALAVACGVVLLPVRAAEQGFVPLLDPEHNDGWKHVGEGSVDILAGVLKTVGGPGACWYMKQGFGDFDLRLEFRADEPTSNSGVFLRCPAPDAPDGHAGYEVQIYGRSGKDQPTGSIYGYQPPTSVPLNPVGQWNDLEIIVIGQQYTVKLNGRTTNHFTGNKGTTGYIGLQNHPRGPVQIRNVRVKDLTPPDAFLPKIEAATGAAPGLSFIESLSRIAPNAMAWVLAPLDEAVPKDIRQNLTFLREDLLDEYRQKPKASADAYKVAYQLCSSMISALDERDQTLVRAGFRAAQADTTTGISNDQALSARRNYMMSWPQYRREQLQRNELKSQAVAEAEVLKERPKVEWSERTAVIRTTLDGIYARFREAVRESAPAK